MFDYIRRFAYFVSNYRGDSFKATVEELTPAEGLTLSLQYTLRQQYLPVYKRGGTCVDRYRLRSLCRGNEKTP